jgi:hypothetical protein
VEVSFPALAGRLGLSVLLPPGARTEALGGGATASETIWPLRISPALAVRIGAFTLHIGPDALLALGFGSSDGITAPSSRTRLALSLGAAAALQRPLGRWRLVADVAAYHHLTGRGFHIDTPDGGRRLVLDSPAWQALVAIGVSRAFSP